MKHTGIMERLSLTQISVLLELLKQGILDGEYHDYRGPSATEGWGGAGVLFCTDRGPVVASDFYPAPRMVVTPHAHAAGWLLNNLGAIFSSAGLLDHLSKHGFYNHLADAANDSTALQSETAEQLLLDMHTKACAMLDKVSAVYS